MPSGAVNEALARTAMAKVMRESFAIMLMEFDGGRIWVGLLEVLVAWDMIRFRQMLTNAVFVCCEDCGKILEV
jgi:hypothetical protein